MSLHSVIPSAVLQKTVNASVLIVKTKRASVNVIPTAQSAIKTATVFARKKRIKLITNTRKIFLVFWGFGFLGFLVL
jgi:hypothetical protein